MCLYIIKLSVVLSAFCLFSVDCDNCLGEQQFRRYFKVKKCRRSDSPVISRSNFGTVRECVTYAREKNGMAFNYSPLEAKRKKLKPGEYFYNCNVLGCPEVLNQVTTLINDTAYDYYSSYANFSVLVNSTCVKSLGMFRVFQEKENYTRAVEICQGIGADLANVLSEQRTQAVSTLVSSLVTDWFKAAYIGLDDRVKEGSYQTPLGDSIMCYKYRAWSPGHPRNFIKSDDCVAIDSERSWKVVNCKIKMPFVCEYFPTSTRKNNVDYSDVECEELEDEEHIRECKEVQSNQNRKKKRRNRCLEP